MGKGKVKFVIYKVGSNKKEVVVDEVGHDQDYEVFREKLTSARDDKGNVAPRYAVYDVEYELGAGEGKRCVISSPLSSYSFSSMSFPFETVLVDLLTIVFLRYDRSKIVFISWVPTEAPTFVCPASPF